MTRSSPEPGLSRDVAFPAENSGSCATCRGALPTHRFGRPREYCCAACADVASALRRLQRAIPCVPDPKALRSLFVSEVLNRLPVDREALSRRAKRQARGEGGKFAKPRVSD